jgi:hypothetical protein
LHRRTLTIEVLGHFERLTWIVEVWVAATRATLRKGKGVSKSQNG